MDGWDDGDLMDGWMVLFLDGTFADWTIMTLVWLKFCSAALLVSGKKLLVQMSNERSKIREVRTKILQHLIGAHFVHVHVFFHKPLPEPSDLWPTNSVY